jgi:hypothetical protein
MFGIEAGKLADHPVAVCGNPNGNGKVVAEFAHVLPCSPGNDDGHDQCWKNHYNAQWFPDHAPGHIFKQPEHDMQVFHFAVLQRNFIYLFVWCLVAHGVVFAVRNKNKE